MVPSTRLVYEFKRRLHHRDTSYSGAIRIPDICSYLTEGLMTYFENSAKVVETNPLVSNDLRNYESEPVELEIIKRDKKRVVAKLKDDHYKLLNQKICVSRESCGKAEIDHVLILQSDDINSALGNEMLKPSFEWRETVGEINSEGLVIYHNCEFDIDSVTVTYLKKPEEIHAPSLTEAGEYDHWDLDRKQREDTVLNMPTFAYRKVVDIAVLIALRDLGDLKDFQSQVNKIINLDKIHI